MSTQQHNQDNFPFEEALPCSVAVNRLRSENMGATLRDGPPQSVSPATSEIPVQVAEMRGGSEVILMVEDDPSVRKLAAMVLRELGYTVLEAGDGLEALQLWEKQNREIKLLFTDMMMPGNMTGLDLALLLRQKQPSLKVMSSSGDILNEKTSLLKEGQDIVYLPKPYEPATLARTVRHCLDQNLTRAM